MDSCKKRVPFVRDFAREIKKVRVVAWFDEKEAGAKAVHREKDSLGLASTEKLPGPFRVILFQKNLRKKNDCVLCDFSSFEEARKDEKLANFLHPEEDTDSGVLCKHCGHFQCRICLGKLHALSLGTHADFLHLDDFLSKPLNHVAFVDRCSCCSWKFDIPTLSNVSYTSVKQKYQQWDGVLWFPEYGIVVPSCLGTFDVHALAQVNSRELGVLHGVVSPEMALHLENSGIIADGTKQASATTNISVKFMCEELKRLVVAKVQLRVYARCDPLYSDFCLGSDITEKEARRATCILTKEEMEAAKEQGIDIVCIVGNSFHADSKDRFLLVGRVLSSSALLGKIELKADSLFKALKDKLSNDGYEYRRMGGSSGKARFDKDLFRFIHRGGTTCRRGVGMILERCKDGRNWNFIYKSAYDQEFKRVRHSPPVAGGQVDPGRIDWRDASLAGFRQFYVECKTVLPYILDAVNEASSSTFSFAVSAIKDEIHCIRHAFIESTRDETSFDEVIVKKHTITLLLAAVRLHRDKAHSSVKKGDQDYSFLEYKFVFEVPSETARLNTMELPVARLRGGAGRLRAAVATASHSCKK